MNGVLLMTCLHGQRNSAHRCTGGSGGWLAPRSCSRPPRFGVGSGSVVGGGRWDGIAGQPVGIENSDRQGCGLPDMAHSSNSSSSSGDSPVSTTTVWSSNEHHSLSILSDRSRGHSAGSVYHPLSSSTKSSS